jgi:hypothetical protein
VIALVLAAYANDTKLLLTPLPDPELPDAPELEPEPLPEPGVPVDGLFVLLALLLLVLPHEASKPT